MNHFDHALDTTRTLGEAFTAIKDRDHPLTLSRDGANAILTNVLASIIQPVVAGGGAGQAFCGGDAARARAGGALEERDGAGEGDPGGDPRA
jgi:hypothetical protein